MGCSYGFILLFTPFLYITVDIINGFNVETFFIPYVQWPI